MKRCLIIICVYVISNVAVAQTAYITNKDGCWLKESIKGTNTHFLDFNSEIEIIRDSFPLNSTRWCFVNSLNGKGWVSVFEIGKKWCPVDSALYKSANIFLAELKFKKTLETFMYNNWELNYHEDNRCYGSTDGRALDLSKDQIDTSIHLKVFCDGKGWMGCDNIDSSTYFIDFKLQNKIDEWDRLYIMNIDYCNNSIMLGMGGASDYLEFVCVKIKGRYLIRIVNYKSEDPG